MFELPIKDFKELTAIPAEYWLENRNRLLQGIRERLGDKLKPNSFILMKGHEEFAMTPDSDSGKDPQCEPNFLYIFGAPFVYNLHGLLNVDSGEAALVVQDLTETEMVFEGGVTVESAPKDYNVSRIITEKQLEVEMDRCTGDIFVLRGKIRNNMTKEAQYPWLQKHSLNTGDLYAVLCDLRAVKSKTEIAIMREVVNITCEGHKYIMKQIKPGMGEHHVSELFKLHCGLEGTSKLAYGTICGSGRNASILHYIVNNKVCHDGELILMDVGVMGNGYCADVTSTFPINGKFDDKQKQIYSACLKSNLDSMAMVKPGAKFRDVQLKSFEVLCEELLKIGLFKGTVKELMDNRIFACIMPHSLGHYLGMFTHDVGCCIHSDENNCSISTPLQACDGLKAGMVITIEPGIYFIRSIIDNHKKNPEKAKYIDFDLLEQYFYIGGVRIEDDVLVTETGYENMSVLPRTVEEIESFMAAK